ncbi:hypothetical protein STEG23_009547, partial [Scotinomys teguina]
MTLPATELQASLGFASSLNALHAVALQLGHGVPGQSLISCPDQLQCLGLMRKGYPYRKEEVGPCPCPTTGPPDCIVQAFVGNSGRGRSYQMPWTTVIDGWELPCGCWELNSGPSKEHLVLLTTELSLQPTSYFVKNPVFVHEKIVAVEFLTLEWVGSETADASRFSDRSCESPSTTSEPALSRSQ